MTHKGQCFCGNIRYSIDAEPLRTLTCWCRDCQYVSSGSATNNVFFPEDSVNFETPPTTIRKIAYSGNKIERGFCPKCGSQMFSRTIEPAGIPMRIRAGTLDDRELLAPQAAIWVNSAPSWAQIDPDIPHHGQGPDSPLVNES